MIEKVIQHIDQHIGNYVQQLKAMLKIESISTDPAKKGDIRRAADWLAGVFKESGLATEIMETARHPAVYAQPAGQSGKAKTLIYGHYDVQPAGDVSLWKSPPFDPTEREGSLFARGSADDKGQMLTHVFAAQAWMKVAGKLPVPVKFLIEGEEEISSPNLEGLIRKNKDKFACDYVTLSDTSKFNAQTPAITYGTKGLVYKEIRLVGPKQDLHSGVFGGTVTNPGNALAQIIAGLRDSRNRVTIPTFYDDVAELGAEEKSKLLSLPFDEAAYMKTLGVAAMTGEEGCKTIERKWTRPTLDVNGLHGGFTGEGSMTIIPSKMMAKVSMRLVPFQDHKKISAAFDEAVKKLAPPGVTVEILTHGSCNAYACPLELPGMKAAAQAVEKGYGKTPVFIREGGTLPILPMFKEVLGAHSIMMGFSDPNCNLHGPNEFLGLDDFHKGIRSAAHYLNELAKA